MQNKLRLLGCALSIGLAVAVRARAKEVAANLAQAVIEEGNRLFDILEFAKALAVHKARYAATESFAIYRFENQR